ncbi:potassium-transporting ATPase subunit KdpC [Cypionkella sp.]|uniref:potassium-transporting ATPase subunit KdpC n=1 Tax=Cypionkella sp. TaxID=2811411 RepID=UPI002ABB5D05|nr:potassium-transporting ATPase subunit KdpC [Cypionkella sp.]MDZ4395346.1 potassium-transporting ATPase subunit KdpC [Cypionkella sp.]
MFSYLRPAITLTLGFTVLTGLAYPLAMTGVAQTLFPAAANGSFIEKDGAVIGSALIGQSFTNPGYLQPRPSASNYGATPSGASNLGPTNAALIASVAERRAAYTAENGAEAPIDAVTASASGLDPDISPENARAQAARIASARKADPAAVQALIDTQIKAPLLGLYGEPTVNVLQTNLALDAAFPVAP